VQCDKVCDFQTTTIAPHHSNPAQPNKLSKPPTIHTTNQHPQQSPFDMSTFAANPYALYEPPLEFVDHQHERLHQHNTLLGVMARRRPDQKTYPNHPDVDISDAITHYLIELEVPGIKDAEAITINWTSFKSLVVAGTTFRSWEPKAAKVDLQAANESEKSKNGVGLDVKALKDAQNKAEDAAAAAADEYPPYLVVGERMIGAFRREFHFPVDIDVKKVEAKLEAGLLRIYVPRKSHMDLKGSGKVKVQSLD
jgi:HSP20 family molecular chaperone IbpA